MGERRTLPAALVGTSVLGVRAKVRGVRTHWLDRRERRAPHLRLAALAACAGRGGGAKSVGEGHTLPNGAALVGTSSLGVRAKGRGVRTHWRDRRERRAPTCA